VGDDERGFTRKRFDMASEGKIKDRIDDAITLGADRIDVFPGMTNHGRNGVTYRLNKLVDQGAAGHIHVHAVIAVKSESGQKLHPGPETFREWREVYAQHAQAEGLRIVATSTRERASSQSYGPKDKAIVDVADRPVRRARRETVLTRPTLPTADFSTMPASAIARSNPIRLPMSPPDRKVVSESVLAWRAVAAEQPATRPAKDMLERLLLAQAVGDVAVSIFNQLSLHFKSVIAALYLRH
jgi:hypothetical protein